MPTETLIAPPPPVDDTSFNPSDFELPDGDQLLNDVSAFIGRYLQCSEHQRTILALWTLHTHSLPAAQVTPYLSIQSAEKQSGKSLCLQLLSLLCDHPTLTASFTANTLSRRLDDKVSTVLLDECQAILGTRARSKGPVLRAILASGFHRGIGYTDSTHERNIFSPKAFAGMGQLPEALASRSIPIILQPLGGSPGKERVAQPPGSPARAGVARDGVEVPSAVEVAYKKAVFPNNHAVCNTVTHSGDARVAQSPSPLGGSPGTLVRGERSELRREPAGAGEKAIRRFNLRHASIEAKPLEERLSLWAEGNLPIVKEMPFYSREDFPAGLSPRQQDMIEPLLQLADFIGAEWPSRIREALVAAFEEEAAFELRLSLLLLADIRDCFAHHDYPERLSSATLLDWMHTRPTRPWDVDGPITARTIARLLAPFEIHPRLQRIPGASGPARGYELQNFKELWKTHFNFEVPPPLTHEESIRKFRAKMLEQSQLKIPNKDAACNAITHPDSISKISADQCQSVVIDPGLPVSPKANSQELNAGVFSNKDAVCNAVTHPDSISKISADQCQSVVKDPGLPVSPKANSQEPKTGVFYNNDATCNAITHPDSIFKISADQCQSVVKDPDLPIVRQNGSSSTVQPGL